MSKNSFRSKFLCFLCICELKWTVESNKKTSKNQKTSHFVQQIIMISVIYNSKKSRHTHVEI